MKMYFVGINGDVVLLGESPYGRRQDEIVNALFRTGHGCAHEDGKSHCDLPHEKVSIGENRNGFTPHPRMWVSGDCSGAYTGWGMGISEIDVPDELVGTSEGALVVLRAEVERLETRVAVAAVIAGCCHEERTESRPDPDNDKRVNICVACAVQYDAVNWR